MAIAPGFVDLQFLFAQRIIQAGWNVINDAVLQTALIHAQMLNELLAGVADRWDPNAPQTQFRLPVATEMQPLEGEDDSPLPVRGYDSYQIAAPLFDVGLAWGTGRKSRAKMTVQDANDNTIHALQADSRWNRRHMLAALFDNESYTFADPKWGNLTIKPLANNDTDTYNLTTGETATENHYLAQAAAIDATHYPFSTINDELVEHPDNQGDIVVYVAKSLKTSITALADFKPYNNNRRIQPGVSTDVLTDFPDVPFGDRRLGWVEDGDCYIVQWDALPSGYMIAMPTGNSKKPLGYREEPEAELQGLRPEYASYDGNHVVTRMLRTRGYAVQNRTAALVYQIGNATYQIPTGYNTPVI